MARPEVGRIRPRHILMVVVLPAPFGPRNPNTSPRRTSRSRSRTACRLPYALVSLSVTSTSSLTPRVSGPGARPVFARRNGIRTSSGRNLPAYLPRDDAFSSSSRRPGRPPRATVQSVEIARSLRRRLDMRAPFERDAALALGLGVLVFAELVSLHGLEGYDPTPPAVWPLLAAATIAPLAWRRRYPIAVVGAQTVAETVSVVVSGHLGFSVVMLASLLVGAYSAGAHAGRRGWSLAAVVLLGLVPGIALGSTRLVTGAIPGVDVVIPLTAWLIGNAVRGHRRHIADLRE